MHCSQSIDRAHNIGFLEGELDRFGGCPYALYCDVAHYKQERNSHKLALASEEEPDDVHAPRKTD
jgi:hypothetical protein